jgi:hypothetical protein
MELRIQSSPPFGPTRAPNGPNSGLVGPQGIQRVTHTRFGRRPLSLSAKTDAIAAEAAALSNRSPLAQATTASHIPSPIALARSPNFGPQPGSSISPSFGPTQVGQPLRPQQQLRPQPFSQAPRPAFAQAAMGSTQSSASGSSLSSARDANYFVSPFQNHYDQLGKLSHYPSCLLDIELCRPRINPLVQTRSTRTKRICSTNPNPKAQPFRRHPSPHRIYLSTCSNSNRLHHQFRPQFPMSTKHRCHLLIPRLEQGKCRRWRVNLIHLILCWMQILLAYRPVCISLLHSLSTIDECSTYHYDSSPTFIN